MTTENTKYIIKSYVCFLSPKNEKKKTYIFLSFFYSVIYAQKVKKENFSCCLDVISKVLSSLTVWETDIAKLRVRNQKNCKNEGYKEKLPGKMVNWLVFPFPISCSTLRSGLFSAADADFNWPKWSSKSTGWDPRPLHQVTDDNADALFSLANTLCMAICTYKYRVLVTSFLRLQLAS